MGMILHRHLRGTLGAEKPEEKKVEAETPKEEPVEETKKRGRQSTKKG